MKFVKIIFLILITLSSLPGQSIRLIIFPELSTLDLSAFATVEELQGAPRVFCVDIFPTGQYVVLEGNVEWRRVGSNEYEQLLHFVTKPFISRTLCNDDIDRVDVKVQDFDSNNSLIEANIRLGKPTGTYRLTVILFDSAKTEELSRDQRELLFLNPTQTLTIINPRPNNSYDAGNLLVEWTPVQGVNEYFIRASERDDPAQSLEDALVKGIPLVSLKSVGIATSVNLREILDRELKPGSEVVLQVSGNIPGPSGGRKIFSEIVNFTIFNPESQYYSILIERAMRALIKLGDNELIELLRSGQIKPEQLQIRKDDGSIMTFEEFVIFLESNPDNILRIIRE